MLTRTDKLRTVRDCYVFVSWTLTVGSGRARARAGFLVLYVYVLCWFFCFGSSFIHYLTLWQDSCFLAFWWPSYYLIVSLLLTVSTECAMISGRLKVLGIERGVWFSDAGTPSDFGFFVCGLLLPYMSHSAGWPGPRGQTLFSWTLGSRNMWQRLNLWGNSPRMNALYGKRENCPCAFF
jgi:hypothetical protein